MSTHTIERPVERPVIDLESRFPGRYLSLTSFKRDGTGVATPLWFVRDGDRLLALTGLRSGKVKRIRRNPEVLLAPCRPSGKLRGEPMKGRVEVLTATAELDRTQELLMKRYRLTYRVIGLAYRIGRRLRRQPEVPEGAVLVMTVE